jgi:hypothetical protein
LIKRRISVLGRKKWKILGNYGKAAIITKKSGKINAECHEIIPDCKKTHPQIEMHPIVYTK